MDNAPGAVASAGMAVRYVCDNCGFRGLEPDAETADMLLCEMCGEPVMEDRDRVRDPRTEHRENGDRR